MDAESDDDTDVFDREATSCFDLWSLCHFVSIADVVDFVSAKAGDTFPLEDDSQ
jgi:hypothetical protein